jgi:hypothetical protein
MGEKAISRQLNISAAGASIWRYRLPLLLAKSFEHKGSFRQNLDHR